MIESNRARTKRVPLRWVDLLCVALTLLLIACGAEGGQSPLPSPPPTDPGPTETPNQPHSPIPSPEPPLPSPNPTSTPLPSPSPTQPTSALYTVQPGDTLLQLARRYGVPMAAIQLENQLGASTNLQAGHSLSIPPPDGWEDASPFWVLHMVAQGETLAGIAQKYGVEQDTLQSVNGLTDANTLTIGQELILPLEGPVAAVRPSPTPVPPTPIPTHPPTVAPTAVPAIAAPAAPPPADVATWPGEIARLINQQRAAHGLPPMSYDERLAQAAQAHANDCAQRGWCSHTGSDGAYVKARVRRAGYDGAGWAECWAQSLTPQGAIDMWMNETPPNDPHRRTLLSDWLSEVGVGVAQTDWGYYFIADFGRP